MRKTSWLCMAAAFALGALLAFTPAAWAIQKIDVDHELFKKLKKHEEQIGWDLFHKHGMELVRVKFTGMLGAFNFNLENRTLPTSPLVAGQQQITNCGTSPLDKQFNFSRTLEESATITTSQTISAGVSTTVSCDIPFTSAGVESSFHMDVETSKSTQKTTTQSKTWSDTTSYATKPGRKAKVQFIIEEAKAKEIPFTGKIEMIGTAQVTMREKGKVCLYKHAHFGGWSECNHAGENVSWIGKAHNDAVSSIKITGPLSVTVYKDVHYSGKHKKFSKSTKWVGDGWNDLISSYKVHGTTGTKSIQVSRYLKSRAERSINLSGVMRAAQGVDSYVTVTEVAADCSQYAAKAGDKTAVKVFQPHELKNVAPMKGSKIISRKLRPGARRR